MWTATVPIIIYVLHALPKVNDSAIQIAWVKSLQTKMFYAGFKHSNWLKVDQPIRKRAWRGIV